MADLIRQDVVQYAREHTTPVRGQLERVGEWTRQNTSAPGMMSGLAEARLLQALIRAGGARQVLEIGTFTGFGTLAMAAAVGPAGRVTTLEVDPETAKAARAHIAASEYADRVDLILGDARQTIERLPGPFDLVYIDAWKAAYPAYYEAVLPKLAARGVIVADNLFRAGRALDPRSEDESTAGIRAFAAAVQADERVDNVLLTVGDGLMLAWHRGEPPASSDE